jgi:predicted ATPase/DNA-binding CsgD family transcriptional regulator
VSVSPSAIRSSFIGRDRDLAALERMLLRPETRLVTVTGPGGVGKTRIVSELAPGLHAEFPAGVWFVPVAHVRDADLVLAAIAAELGIRDLDSGETLERVADRLGNERSLIVLDNLEQVIECGPAVARLLQAAPQVTILATSRQPLQLQGEVEYPLRPLQIDGSNGKETPAEALFAARAREASYGFAISEENREAVRQISRRLGGIPLAIELAASWVKVLPPQRLLENLDRQLDVLVRGARDLPIRQQTMRSAIAWSYQLLSEREQVLFRQLSVFSGPFTLSDAEAVALSIESIDPDEMPELALLETLASLVTKSLIQVADDSVDPIEPEYGMLEIIRAFAAEQLLEAGECNLLCDRHLAHFVSLAERWTGGLASEQRDARLAQLDREYANFRAALDWAVESGDRDAGLRLVAALWLYWDWRGFHAEGARWRDKVLAIEGESDPALLSSALYAGAAIAFMQANYPRSMELAEACLASAEASGNDAVIARALVALGNATYDQGQIDRSEEVYTRSLAMSRKTDDARSLQVSLVNLGYVYYQQGRFAEAKTLFEEGVALESRTGHSAGAAWARVGRAQTDHRLGDLDGAERQLTFLIERQRSADTGQLAAALTACAALYRAQGRIAEAEPLAREAIENRVARDERALLTDSLSELAALALSAGAAPSGVTLAAAIAGQRARIGYGLPDQERKIHQSLVETARASLGERAFERAWSRGDRMTIAEAIGFANELTLGASPEMSSVDGISDENALLTPREREVLSLVIEGRTDREIAHALSISTGTASRHVANILHKLDVPTRSAAAAWYIRQARS